MARLLSMNVFRFLVFTLIVVISGAVITRDSWLFPIFSYLSVNRPVKAEVLVIEGWLSDPMLRQAGAEFLRGKYSICLISGRNRFPRSTAETLIRFGVNSSVIHITEANMQNGQKTYHRALAARQWLKAHHPEVRTLNVFTAGPHGRKSWIVFKRVFGPGFSVGIVSSSVDQDDPTLGWKSAHGMWNMARYMLGYLYARVWPFEN